MVLDKGEMAEFDSPSNLIAQRGAFYKMAKDSGLVWSRRRLIVQMLLWSPLSSSGPLLWWSCVKERGGDKVGVLRFVDRVFDN